MVDERLVEKTYIPTKRAAQQDEPTQQDGEEDICHAYSVFRGAGKYTWKLDDRPTGDWTWSLQHSMAGKHS